ncbi:MAG TPA: carboxypeptidase-like regulatory domain-containing protein, partial [Bryobacteraceae bacterium]|nr:carboxypeptidase-like regulatory domain-containing protein [Bryobacteraceae bacterium]
MNHPSALRAVFLLSAVAASVALAQVTGSINGTVVDATGAAVPGATLVLTNTQTGTGDTNLVVERDEDCCRSYFRFVFGCPLHNSLNPVGSLSRCPVLLARDLSGFPALLHS